MKNILKTILLFTSLVAIVSCTNLDEELLTQITNDISTPGIDDGSGGGGEGGPTAGAFSKLRDGAAGDGPDYNINSLTAGESAVTQKGGDWYDGGVYIDLHRHGFNTNNWWFEDAMNDMYSGVLECNSILDGSLDNNQTAQVRILRAYFHFKLIDDFGRVKIFNTPGNEGNEPQLSRRAAFDAVEGEILDVLGISSVNPAMDLSTSFLGTDMNPYGVNQYAALGLLAKMYLNAEVWTGTPRYQEARDAASYIIDNSGYVLADDGYQVANLGQRPAVESDPAVLVGYAALFAPNNDFNPEMIWSINYDEVTAGGQNFAHASLHYSSQFTWNMGDQPWNGHVVLEEFYNLYEDGDDRKVNNFIVGKQLDYGGSALIDFAASDGKLEIEYTPYINELEPDASRVGGARYGKFSFKQFQRGSANNDYPIIRLGEMYLIRGEAMARISGNWADATNDFNTIRARAHVSLFSATTEQDVLDERAREMFMEKTRRQDLIRFGKFNDPWWEKPASEPYKQLFPIAPGIINSSGGTLTQNPGYPGAN